MAKPQLMNTRAAMRRRIRELELAANASSAGEAAARPANGRTAESGWAIRSAVIAAIATLLASLGGLYFSAQSMRQATEQSRQAQTAQTSERFSRSVEQLGSANVAVRTGAVYSFARLMRDSPSDQLAIVEILSNFIRVQAAQVPVPPPPRTVPPTGISLGGVTCDPYRRPPPDLLAALKVLDEQPMPRSRKESDGSVTTWRSMLLRGANLSRLYLFRVSMRDADLTLANLNGASLRSGNLSGSDLTGANLRSADLSYADLTEAQLTVVMWNGANLHEVKVSAGVDLPDAEPSTNLCNS